MPVVSWRDQQNVLARLARVHVTGAGAQTQLGLLDPAAVHAMSDQDLATLTGGTVSPPVSGLPHGSYGYGPYGIGPYGPGTFGSLYPASAQYPDPFLYPH